ncbi:lysosome-associated membrane glycoprotein 1-like [Belonocnema kinseyi]|uniref:lysosome-associated membrane glycoprotein 1-like n=1 Tax=Belonocnema kinseyi TaxID=2817044 RepID=UPI00143D452F|nr:lysosome-associated membrane glycoprotein 1-like [Belonocnema kinseyi]
MMLPKVLLLLCSAVILVSAAEDAGSITARVVTTPKATTSKSPPEPEPEPSTTTVNTTSTATPSTTAPTTITESTTTPTKPTPPTTTPTSTTPSTTTTESTTTPTKPTAPTTTPTTPSPPTSSTVPSTTSGPPTTKAPPTPVPLETGKWFWNGTNETCIVVEMAVQFEIMYPSNMTNNTSSQKLNLPAKSVAVNGSCNPMEQILTLSWNSTLGSDNDSLTIHFVKNVSSKQYTLHHLELVILPQELPNYNSTSNKTLKYVHMKDEFQTKLSNSYRCANPPKFNLTNEGSNVKVGTIQLSNVQFQAFRSDKTINFGQAEDCITDTPDVVPIAVGCVLAILVVIVLVAYLIGRKRAQARGYLSM